MLWRLRCWLLAWLTRDTGDTVAEVDWQTGQLVEPMPGGPWGWLLRARSPIIGNYPQSDK